MMNGMMNGGMMGRFGGGNMMHGRGFDGGYGGGFGGGFGIEGILASALHLVFWLVVIFIIVKLVKHYFPQSPLKFLSKDEPLDILRQRYAKGEIDTEDFIIRKNALENINTTVNTTKTTSNTNTTTNTNTNTDDINKNN